MDRENLLEGNSHSHDRRGQGHDNHTHSGVRANQAIGVMVITRLPLTVTTDDGGTGLGATTVQLKLGLGRLSAVVYEACVVDCIRGTRG